MNFIFPLILGCCHHPNWRTHIFQDGVAKNHQPVVVFHGWKETTWTFINGITNMIFPSIIYKKPLIYSHYNMIFPLKNIQTTNQQHIQWGLGRHAFGADGRGDGRDRGGRGEGMRLGEICEGKGYAQQSMVSAYRISYHVYIYIYIVSISISIPIFVL